MVSIETNVVINIQQLMMSYDILLLYSIQELANDAMNRKQSWTTCSEETLGVGTTDNANRNDSMDKTQISAENNDVIELDGSDEGSVVSC